MTNRIACGVVVSLLLMLWPVAPAVAEEEAPQMIALLEEYHVYPDRAEDFAAYMKEAKEAAAAHAYPYDWDVYALDDLRYLAITWVDGMAGIDEMQAAWAELTEKWGQEAAAAWAEKTFETMSHWSSSVWKPRPDLSYRPAGQADEQAYIVWGLLSIKLGHQDEVEALFREYLGAFAERKVPYGWRAAEIMIGPGYPTLAFVDWAASPGSYWMRHDEEEKDEVLGAKSAEIWRKMMPHIRGFDYVTGHYLKELSHHPEKMEEE
jgi:hypothetical protein